MNQQEPGSGVYYERTALAWQRTALALVAGAAIVSRLALDRLGVLAGVSVVVAAPVMVWVLWASRRRDHSHSWTRPALHQRGGRAAAALAGVCVVIALTEMAALLVGGRTSG